MGKKMWILVIGICAIFLGIILTLRSLGGTKTASNGSYDLAAMKAISEKIDYTGLDPWKILPASDLSGGLPENVKGEVAADTTPIVIVEYGDYQCSYCAAMNPVLNQIIEDYQGKAVATLRTYVLSYHQNGVQMAAAANAAAQQGFWAKFKDLVFANQSEWFYAEGEKLQSQIEDYFLRASDSQGDLEKFRTDMASAATLQKIAFDHGLGETAKIGGTPWFYIDGEWISNKNGDKDLSPTELGARIREKLTEKLGK